MAVVNPLRNDWEAGAHLGTKTRRWNPKSFALHLLARATSSHSSIFVQTAICMKQNAYKMDPQCLPPGKVFVRRHPKAGLRVIALEAARLRSLSYVNHAGWRSSPTGARCAPASIGLKDLERMESSGAIAMRPKKKPLCFCGATGRHAEVLASQEMRRPADVVILVGPAPRIQRGSGMPQAR